MSLLSDILRYSRHQLGPVLVIACFEGGSIFMDTNYEFYQQMDLNQDSNLRPLKFYFLSGVVHVILFSLAIIVGALMPKPEIPALMEITILDTPSPSVSLAAPGAVPPPSAAIAAPVAKAAKAAKTIVAQTATAKGHDADTVMVPSQMAPPSRIAEAKHPSPVAAPAKAAPAVKSAQAKVMFQGPTVAQSEEVAPILETDDFEQTLKAKIIVPTKQIQDSDIAEDLDKVDEEHASKIAALKKSMEHDTSGALSEEEQNLEAARRDAQQQDEIMDKNAAALKAANRSKVKQAIIAEKTAAQEQASALAAQQAAEAAAQAEANARAAQSAAAAQQYSRQMALGSSLGVNGPVRTLSEVRQAPGNKRPAYEKEDRLAGRQGDVSFLAYVGTDGTIKQFKLLQSTGHRSLDAHTLSAIRDWKFLPGNEGWVEIPFRWDLKGGPQEMTATLRRSLSQK